MISVRKNVFETNSSSTHSMCICTEEEYEKFRSGDMIYDDWDDKLVAIPNSKIEENKYRYKLFEDMGQDLKYYSHRFETPSGDKMVAFGEYGFDY